VWKHIVSACERSTAGCWAKVKLVQDRDGRMNYVGTETSHTLSVCLNELRCNETTF